MAFARNVRISSLRMVHRARSSHIGACFSMTDILAVLFTSVLRVDPADPLRPDRDRLIVSKGHAAAALYASLAERGFLPHAELETYCEDGSNLSGHVTRTAPGIEVSSGSLGHGLPMGCGMALAAKRDGSPARVFVVLGDGELNEGSNWEAAQFAARHGLDNLTAVVDHNKLQGYGTTDEVLGLSDIAGRFAAFGWAAHEADGHDHARLAALLGAGPGQGQPVCIVAHTVKGKGVSFMEGQLAWHYRSPDDETFQRALAELEGRS